MYVVETKDFPVISVWIFSKPESLEMSFHQASLDGIVCLSDIKDKSDLVTPKLEQVIEYVGKSVRSFDGDVIQVGGSILERAIGDKVDWS